MPYAGSGALHGHTASVHEKTAVRQAEITGNSNVSGRINELKAQTGLDPQISWDCDYFNGTKVQLNGDIKVTLTQRVDIGFFVFGSFPIDLRARASGKSEVYYK